jgi:hypothetical protein
MLFLAVPLVMIGVNTSIAGLIYGHHVIKRKIERFAAKPKYLKKLKEKVNDKDLYEETAGPLNEQGDALETKIKPGKFVKAIAAECKCKFGCPTNTWANREAIRKYACELMKQKGHRAVHIARDYDKVIDLVLTPTKAQMDRRRHYHGTSYLFRRTADGYNKLYHDKGPRAR